ncbi:hypothetical protein SLEP1_g46120 [Rubroshorea leprosula]|uniref:Uncharacterized protein n=1 Tax=Rubroshorea leprosula TaxID=152421 RepID=A0AAV5LNL1_9ROSI|nr:hypothetical protein SLEP1_g46120 [Rubroshorea leprosula]
MGSLSTSVTSMLPSNPRSSVFEQHRSLFLSRTRSKKKNQAIVPVARLFGPAIFEASKLKVLFLGVDEKKHPGNLPRTYTLTHIVVIVSLITNSNLSESHSTSASVFKCMPHRGITGKLGRGSSPCFILYKTHN